MDRQYAAPRTVPPPHPGQDKRVAGEAKEFRYAIGLDRAGRVTAEGSAPLDLEAAWSPEHLVLAGLARCTLQSLRFHASLVGVDFLASASASGVVRKREEDDRYAFVELGVEIDLELEPIPPGEELTALIQKAERDCFVGASLTPSPRYRWLVNGASL
jgi:organic hydroperoxide reductase OsmC/OhrA